MYASFSPLKVLEWNAFKNDTMVDIFQLWSKLKHSDYENKLFLIKSDGNNVKWYICHDYM